MYPDHCVGSIEKKKVIWIVTGKNGGGKNGSVRTQKREQTRNVLLSRSLCWFYREKESDLDSYW